MDNILNRGYGGINMNVYEERFKDKVLLVTGSTTGIGRAVAIRAAKEGAKVVVVGRRKEKGEEVVDEIRQDGGEAMFVQIDLSSEESSKQLIETVVNQYGRLDIAINNAGTMGKDIQIHNLEQEEMDRVMNINFFSTVYCCHYEIQQFMKQQTGGVIINNASVAGLVAVAGLPAYNASKHAVNGLTKALAIDYAKYGIRVNSVNPAQTDTPMTRQAKIDISRKVRDAKKAGIENPMSVITTLSCKTTNMQQRAATPEEHAASILYLASDDATHITGAMVQTDGGWSSF